MELPAGFDNWKLNSGREDEVDIQQVMDNRPIGEYFEDYWEDNIDDIVTAIEEFGDKKLGGAAVDRINQRYEDWIREIIRGREL